MGTYTVLALFFGGGLLPGARIMLFLCLLIGAAAQYIALKHGKRFGWWLFPALLVLLWLVLELAASCTVNYTQLVSLLVLAPTLFCLLGAVLGTVLFYLIKAIRTRQKKSASDS